MAGPITRGLSPLPIRNTLISNNDQPIVVDKDIRGSLQYLSGETGDQILDISGRRVQEGMLVYIKNGYEESDTPNPTIRVSETYYQYTLSDGDSDIRDFGDGSLANNIGNWTKWDINSQADSERAFIQFDSDSFPTATGLYVIAYDSTTGRYKFNTANIESEHIVSGSIYRRHLDSEFLEELLQTDSEIVNVRDSDGGNTVANRIRVGDGRALDVVGTPTGDQVLAYSDGDGNLQWAPRDMVQVETVHGHFVSTGDVALSFIADDSDPDLESEIELNLRNRYTAGDFGDTLQIPTVTVNAKGLVTFIEENPLNIASTANNAHIKSTIEDDTTLDLESDVILSRHINDAQILSAHIPDDQIISRHIADDQIISRHIADDQVLSDHIADDQILNNHIADNQIESEHINDALLTKLTTSTTEIMTDILNNSPLIFTEPTSSSRRLSRYRDSDGVIRTVRTASTSGSVFVITFATFTPSFAATYSPADADLEWDEVFDNFTVSVTNPGDVDESDYISEVRAIINASGGVDTDLATYTTTGPNLTPAVGQNWMETFSTANDGSGTAYIGPDTDASDGTDGGDASFTITFTHNTGDGSEILYANGELDFSINWKDPNTNLGFIEDLDDNTFLEAYEDINFNVNTTNMINANNISYNFSTQTNGSVPDNTVDNVRSYNSTFTFNTVVHKDNVGGDTLALTVTSTLDRPLGVTGSAYNVNDTSIDTVTNPSFKYPVYYLVTERIEGLVPSSSDFIVGDQFRADDDLEANVLVGPTETDDNLTSWEQIQIDSLTPSGPDSIIWIAVPNESSTHQNNQPNEFKVGTRGSSFDTIDTNDDSTYFEEDVDFDRDGSVTDLSGTGYAAVPYRLYGFNFAPGSDIDVNRV